ncbi:MAG: hypothetical protein ACK5GN_08580 [Pseudomonadota bacterium]
MIHLLASSGLLLIVLGLSGGAWYLWERSNEALIPAGRYLVLAGFLLSASAACVSYLIGQGWLKKESFTERRIWTLGLLAIFISDWMNRPWGLFKGPTIRGELFVGAIICFILFHYRLWSRFFASWPMVVIGLLIWSFSVAANGMMIFSDDHPMFLFRLKLLRENFPSIPFWSPLWNAGFDARDFFATGALNAYLLSAPLVHLFPVEAIYPILIGGLLWVIAPACLFAAARMLGLPVVAASIATTLSLCSGLFWFRWALKYGTVGFITSTALFPLVAALAIRFIHAERPSRAAMVLVCITTTLMLLWSPSGIAALPILLVALPRIPKLILSKRHLAAACIMLALNLPWMCMMWKVSNVGRFLDSHTAVVPPTPVASSESSNSLAPPNSPASATIYRHKSGTFSLKNALANWQSNATALNPILVVFAIPALIAFSGIARWYLIALCSWLLLLGTAGVSLKPQLELDRMIIIASILVTIPIGQFLYQLFTSAGRGITFTLAAICSGAFVLVSPFTATSVVLNRADDTYSFADKELPSFIRAVSKHAAGGRVLFSGCVLHQFSGGHLAPLPLWAKTPMVASSYAHNIWRYEQPIPESFISRGDQGIKEFLDLMNATVVTAHEPTWIDYFKKRPNEYEQVWRGEIFFVFRRLNYSPSYTMNGSLADLTYTSNSVSFIPTSESLTLKFRHFPFISSTSCSIGASASDAGFNLITLTGCSPGTPVTIKSVSPWQRLIGGSS